MTKNLFIAVTVAVLALTSCGGKDSAPATPAPAPSTPVPTPTPGTGGVGSCPSNANGQSIGTFTGQLTPYYPNLPYGTLSISVGYANGYNMWQPQSPQAVGSGSLTFNSQQMYNQPQVSQSACVATQQNSYNSQNYIWSSQQYPSNNFAAQYNIQMSLTGTLNSNGYSGAEQVQVILGGGNCPTQLISGRITGCVTVQTLSRGTFYYQSN